MAPMTTVMAVTDGFFSQVLASSDTLRTRIAAQGHGTTSTLSTVTRWLRRRASIRGECASS